ncbi:hypothetical protein CC86DRAFT_350806 [Ophiobolus disseminans]|uniref:C3H1-type domain-containing protein n=1 Tax=Ophiobolus disseminans TaxID=1469910 RepID=A0A6A7A0L4_9PLEO|nr:hypothetical protein CC86DRAFT_350806 [Ophiobolus disseminans]
MHACTWEPESGVADTGLLNPWKRQKELMGPRGFRKFIENNESKFNEAVRRHDVARAIRHQKRAKKRSQLKKRPRPQVEVDDSEDDTPLAQGKQATQHKSKKSKENNVASPSTEDAEIGLFVEQIPITRRAPLEQSTSEEEQGSPPSSDSDDSLMGELASKVVSKGLNLGNSILSPRSPKKKPAAQSANSVPKPPVAKTQRQDTITKPLRKATASAALPTPKSVVITEKRAPAESTSLTAPKSVETKEKSAQAAVSAADPSSTTLQRRSTGNVTAPNPSAPVTSLLAKTVESASPVVTKAPLKQTSSTTIKKTGVNPKTVPIRMTNEPKTAPREWKKSKERFSTLQAARRAELRGRAEGTPDPQALDFVGVSPAGLTLPRTASRVDNPYGRREAGNRRMQQIDADEPVEEVVPIQNWEANKAPLVCPHWRLSHNCPYGPAKCNFMHRDKDENGEDLPIGDITGSLPPKYRRVPLTCLFWLNSKHGCKKSEKECLYAHKNTGWMPKDGNDNQPFQIDPNALPVSELPVKSLLTGQGSASHPTRQEKKWMKPHEITCWYWKKGTCQHTPGTCKFKHHDTGIIADPPPSGLTCRNWLRRNCRHTAEQCKFQHYNVETELGQPSFSYDIASALPYKTHDQQAPTPGTVFANGTWIEVDMDDNGPQLATIWDEPQPPAEQIELSLSPPPPPPSPPPPHPPLTLQPSSPPPSPLTLTPPPPPPPPLTTIPAPNSSCQEIKQILDQALDISFTELFECGGHEDSSTMLDRKALLLFHPMDHCEELEVITRWLLMHHVEVSSVWHEGCWDYFRQQMAKGGSGIVIAHPDFEWYSELTGFGKLLQKQVRLWSLGVQEGIEHDSALLDTLPKERHDCIEIFPVGGFIYITDDVFEEKPQLALQIVELFLAKVDKMRHATGSVSPWQEADNAYLHWRLCVRPELMEHLFQRCEEQESELEAGEPDALARAYLYALLIETDYIEQELPIQPLSAVSDKFPIISERRIIAEEKPVDYFNALTSSTEEANLRMIRYYAGLHIEMRRDYRHFFVVHTKPFVPCVRKWKQEIQTIAEVITPEQCVAELQKDADQESRGQMFDFGEKYMPEGKVDTVEEALVSQVTKVQNKQVTRIASPQVTDSQTSMDEGEIRESQHSMEDGEIYPTQ